MSDAAHTNSAIFRIELPKLVARLARVMRDVGRAEELAQDAMVIALERWLTPIRPYGPGEEFEAFGHLRLTPALSKRLRRTAASRGIPVAELVRQVLEFGLP